MAHSPETMHRARILYEGSSLLLKQISYELSISKRTLDRWARQYQWRPRCRIKGEHHERYIRRKVQDDYINTTMRIARIARIYGISPRTVFYWRKKFNWPGRYNCDNF